MLTTVVERSEALKAILIERPLGLAFTEPNEAMRPRLAAFDIRRDFGMAIRSEDAAKLALAGLWLYHDFFDESHAIAQEIETPEGSYWHAILHRREPDAFNAKYWFRRIGDHPVIAKLKEQAPAIGYEFKSPSDFVDCCERVRGTESAEEKLAEAVQMLEWQLLCVHCLSKVT